MNRIYVLLSLTLLVWLSGCQNEHPGEPEEHGHYLVTSPMRRDTVISNSYVCQIHSYRNIEMRALEKGYIQDIFVDEGQQVNEGKQMFQIMPLLYQAELKKAQAEAKFAEIEYLNTKALADSDVVSTNELALARAKFDKANAELALAEVHLGFTEIKAPFTGIMDRLRVRQGSLVDEGDLLTTFSDNSKMWVYFNVPEAEYLNFMLHAQKGHMPKVKLLMANQEFFPYEGDVETIEAEFNNETGNIPFRATFPNPDGLLRHGETGNILMPVALKDALLIPQKATYEVLDKRYVYVLDKDHRIRARHITVVQELPHLFVVSDGLSEDDKVLLEGLRKVKEGEEIEFKYQKPEEAFRHLELYSE